MPKVSPAVLSWARETAGLSLGEAAARAQLRATKKQTPEERLADLEEGRAEPTRPQLLRFAAAYRRPLITFYLARPPAEAARIEDYRSLPDREPSPEEATLAVMVRDIRARQELVKNLLEDIEADPRPFVGTMRIADGVEASRRQLAAALGFELAAFRRGRTTERAFDYLRGLAERTGIFVILAGNLGSFHTNVSVDTFRGFALADPLAPFVVINDQDAKTAWSFTLLHELVHIALGASGISGTRVESEIERFCNDVASGLLLPAAELAQMDVGDGDLDDLRRSISNFAAARVVSSSLVAYRLFLAGTITRDDWQALARQFADDFRASREARQNNGQPNYYVVRRHRLGSALLNLVQLSLDEGLVTPTRAGKVLGVKPRNVSSLLSERAA